MGESLRAPWSDDRPRIFDELVAHFEQQARSDGSSPLELARLLDALRSAGVDVVKLIFAQEMERTLRELVEEGRAVPLRRHRR